MGFLIFYVIIIIFIFSFSKNKKMKAAEQRRTEALLVHKATEGINQNTTFNRSEVQRMTSSAATNTTSAGSSSNTSKSSVTKTTTSSNSTSTTVAGSTTAYLQEKARLDEIEHEKEKRESRQRENQKYGGHLTASRYLLGDPIPSGHKIFICPYCAAENIVKIGYHGDRDCYFCRTHLI